MVYNENLPLRVSIEISNTQCKLLNLFKSLGIRQFRVVDVRRSARGMTRHLVKIPTNNLAKIPKHKTVRMGYGINFGKEVAMWLETDGCNVCNTIVLEEAFLVTAWSTTESKFVYTFIAPNSRAYQKIISKLADYGFESKILGIEKYRTKGSILTKKQEMVFMVSSRDWLL
ncbi:MAG: hypothetical protein ACPLRY_02975 [Candidatus Bathyarchaeales archaeon]